MSAYQPAPPRQSATMLYAKTKPRMLPLKQVGPPPNSPPTPSLLMSSSAVTPQSTIRLSSYTLAVNPLPQTHCRSGRSCNGGRCTCRPGGHRAPVDVMEETILHRRVQRMKWMPAYCHWNSNPRITHHSCQSTQNDRSARRENSSLPSEEGSFPLLLNINVRSALRYVAQSGLPSGGGPSLSFVFNGRSFRIKTRSSGTSFASLIWKLLLPGAEHPLALAGKRLWREPDPHPVLLPRGEGDGGAEAAALRDMHRFLVEPCLDPNRVAGLGLVHSGLDRLQWFGASVPGFSVVGGGVIPGHVEVRGPRARQGTQSRTRSQRFSSSQACCSFPAAFPRWFRFTGSLTLSSPPRPHNGGARESSFIAVCGVVKRLTAPTRRRTGVETGDATKLIVRCSM